MEKRYNWDWKKNEKDFWVRPVTHMAYLGQRWVSHGKSTILDLGAGLGRNAIYLAKQYGFRVTALDESEYAVNYTKQSAIEENVMVDVVKADMFNTVGLGSWLLDIDSEGAQEKAVQIVSEILTKPSSAKAKLRKARNIIDRSRNNAISKSFYL